MISREGSPDSAGAAGVSNLADLLARAASEIAQSAALVDAGSGRRLTWGELDEEVDRVATGLSAMGLVAGYRVVICLPNRVEFVTSYLAAVRSRLVAVPVNPRGATGELVRTIADCGARTVICDRSTVAHVRSAVSGLADALQGADQDLRERAVVPRIVVVDAPTSSDESTYADLARSTAQATPTREDAEGLAVLLYTSGTSGHPRAAMLSHRALVANVEQAAAVRPAIFTGDDVVLGAFRCFTCAA